MIGRRRLRALSAGLLLGGAALAATLGASQVPSPANPLVEWLLVGGGAGIVLGALWAAWRSGTRSIAEDVVRAHNGDDAAHPKALDRALAGVRSDLADIRRLVEEARDAALGTKAGHDRLVEDGLCPALRQVEEARTQLQDAREELERAAAVLTETRPRRSSDPPSLDDSAIRRLRGRQ